jgi:hypothetical protein
VDLNGKESKAAEGIEGAKGVEGTAMATVGSRDSLRDVAAALGGQSLRLTDPISADRLVGCAIDHGVAALLAGVLPDAGLTPDARARLTQYARERRVLASLMDEEVAGVLEELDIHGVRPLVVKGAHLAHAIYPSPELRPRADTDLLIATDESTRVPAALARRGYERVPHVRGTVILGQFHFARTDRIGIVHALDVHWRVAAPLLFEGVLPFETLQSTAVPIPALGPRAFGPSLPHALLLACIHLAAHHRSNAILLWLYDVRLLAEALDGLQQSAFVDTAARCGVSAVCARVLEDARQYFDGPSLAALAARVAARAAERPEPSARLLTISRPVDGLLLDLRTPVSWRTRLTLVREHLWPDADYMRATGARGWLPLAYARRAVSGARKWLRKD